MLLHSLGGVAHLSVFNVGAEFNVMSDIRKGITNYISPLIPKPFHYLNKNKMYHKIVLCYLFVRVYH